MVSMVDQDSQGVQSLSACFSMQAARSVDHLAVSFSGRTATYADLDRFARNISDHIRMAGPKGPIALILDRSISMIAAMIAILKNGVPYVALDPQWPVVRLRYALEDVQPSIIILDHNNERNVADLGISGSRYLVHDSLSGESVAVVAIDKPPALDFPDNLAYILYTSGSLGTPKGVMQTHGNVIRHIKNYASSLLISPADRVGLVTSYAVDAAVMDIYVALLNGAGLYIFDPQLGGGAGLLRWLEENSITIYHSTPTLYRTLLPQLKSSRYKLDSLRLIVLGGEEVLRTDIESFKRYFPSNTRLINGYGPTECTLAMQNVIDHDTSWERFSVPLGRPVDGVHVALVEDEREVTELHKTGEIVLTSQQMAIGYWRRPELTASKFTVTADGGRSYRTGDRGRLLPGGQIEYAGRLDTRLKIRGYSVEPAEVENALLKHPDVAHVASISSEDSDRGHLLAYIVFQLGKRASAKDLHRFLKSHLPSYMIPSEFIFVASLPLTASGKIARKALAEMAATRRPLQNASTVELNSETALSRLICGIWAEKLHRPVSPEDNFFRLGGDSLIATNILLAVEEQLGVCVELGLLLDNPTPQAFSSVLIDLLPKPSSQPAIKASRMRPRLERRLSFSQIRYWERLKAGEDASCFNVCIGYRIDECLDVEGFRKSLLEVMRRQDILRAVISSRFPVQNIGDDSHCPLTVLDYSLTTVPSGVVNDRIQFEAALPFSLDDGPLVRFVLLKLHANQYVFLVAQHHLITDSWSRNIFERELSRIYRCTDRWSPQHALQSSSNYGDFVHWQRRVFYQSDRRLERLGYWRAALKTGKFSPCGLPVESLGTAISRNASSELTSRWSEEIVHALHALSARDQVTMFAVMLAAFKVVLFSYSRQPVICVTTDFANRTRPEWANVCGLFADVLILTDAISSHITFRVFLSQVHNTVVTAMAKQHVPFADLMDQLFPGQLGRYDEIFPVGMFFEEGGNDASAGCGPTDALLRSPWEIGAGTSSRPLMLTVRAGRNEMLCVLTYQCRLFTPVMAGRILARLGAVIQKIAQSPDISVEDLANCEN
ncbi:MAG TPA: amino acid adenylation domain-containing protein [Candidatus Angelobacter sp.]|nr:amino acid adenylation domain-containing protein [Candidatus Angelobacter sp.]